MAVDHSSRLAVRLSTLLVGFSLSIKSIVMQLVSRGGIGKLTFRNQRNLASSAQHFSAFALNRADYSSPQAKRLGVHRLEAMLLENPAHLVGLTILWILISFIWAGASDLLESVTKCYCRKVPLL